MSDDFVNEVYLHLEAGYPLMFVISQEEKRALDLVNRAAEKAGKKVVAPRTSGETRPIAEMLRIDDSDAVLVLDDVHRRLEEPDALRVLADLASEESGQRRTCVVLAPWVELPPELERLSAVLDLPLPSPQQLRQILDASCVEVGVIQAEEDTAKLVRAAQ